MSKPFDAVMKELLDAFTIDWIDWLAETLGLSGRYTASSVDTDLTNVQMNADKVFRITTEQVEFLLHLEPQSSWDGTIAGRLHAYNAILYHKHALPVQTVLILLRPDANSPRLTGELQIDLPNRPRYLSFHYEVIRLWELPVESFLRSGLGSLPLAGLSNEAQGHLVELIQRIDQELHARQATPQQMQSVFMSSFILLGLRYNDEEIRQAFEGITIMRESTTYQAILREGRQVGLQEGRQEGRHVGEIMSRRDDLLTILRERFGDVSQKLETKIKSLDDANLLQSAIRQSVRISHPDELILDPS